MQKKWFIRVAASAVMIGICAWIMPSRAQNVTTPNGAATQQDVAALADPPMSVVDSECTFFGPNREHFLPRIGGLTSDSVPGRMTRQFQTSAASLANAHRVAPFAAAQIGQGSFIDQYIFADLQANNIQPAPKTTDYEFIRRVTLDLTGRIPTAARVAQFMSDPAGAKRAALVDELLASPEWVDKWTMFFGDLYKNTASNTQVQIRPEGRNAFYKYIHDSLAAGKPYSRMAAEMIAAQGANSFDQANGQLNYLPLSVVTGGPNQDIFDQQTANIADQFLGIAHVNCLLCHNGRGHLDSLSLWGSQTVRTQAWGLSAFLAKTRTLKVATPKDPANPNATYNYWALSAFATDYQLNTTTGNRPARQPIGTVKVITPAYLWGGQTPMAGEEYRAALARFITGDFQFARASVNYIWAELFGRGIVDPPDQFDPARLDPNNPPDAPWTLQPSNARLLNALAQWFIDNNYNMKELMRLLVNSDTYQLSSVYPGEWQASYEPYFARHFVRRLWSEELHDSIVIATGAVPSYNVRNFSTASTVYGVTSPGVGKISFAMQSPDVVSTPDNGGAVSQFLDTFLRGNRDDQPRKREGSILQTLGLMNDNFVQSRIHATGTGTSATFLQKQMNTFSGSSLVNSLYMNVLSRMPDSGESAQAVAQLAKGGTAAYKTNAEDLLWTLFNKLDFVFNY
jgi:hypothetical protein